MPKSNTDLPHLKVKLDVEGKKTHKTKQKNPQSQEIKQFYLWYNGFLLLRNYYLLHKGLTEHLAHLGAQLKKANTFSFLFNL